MSVALGDMNGDGVPDLIVSTRGARAGKVKVFDGATLLNTADTVLPTDAFLVKFPVNGYKRGLTVASAVTSTATGSADLIVSTRKTTINGVATPGKVLAFSGQTGALLGSTDPFGTHYNGGIYVAAETGGHVLVSAANKSLVKIFDVSWSGTFTQVGSDINPLGAGTVLNAKNGSGQITAFTTNAGATPEFAVGDLNPQTLRSARSRSTCTPRQVARPRRPRSWPRPVARPSSAWVPLISTRTATISCCWQSCRIPATPSP